MFEHARSLRPSSLLEIFLLLSVLFDVARARTVWLLDEDHVVPSLFTCTVAFKATMLVLESIEKTRFLLPQYQSCSPEETSGTISRAFFLWLAPLLKAGYGKTLLPSDLFPLDQGLKAEPLHAKFQAAWDAVPDQKANGALFSTWMKVLEPSLLAPVLPRLFLAAFTYAQPFLVTRAIELAVLPGGQPYDNYGYGLIVAFVLVYGGISVS